MKTANLLLVVIDKTPLLLKLKLDVSVGFYPEGKHVDRAEFDS